MEALTNLLNSLLTVNANSFGFVEVLISISVAYAGGVLSSLTPCVYPMIPITVSIVGGSPLKVTKDVPRPLKQLLARSLAYVLGMTLIYSFLGVAAGLTGKVFGSFTNTLGWYLALGVTMNLAALVMLDVVPFEPVTWFSPAKRSLYRLFNKKLAANTKPAFNTNDMSVYGAFFLGASSGTIAAPCTTPVLAVILAFIAKTQSVGVGLMLMIAFSLGISTLLLVIAVFASALRVLPRSGSWLKTIKIASGLILLVFAQYLVYRAGNLGGFR